MHIPNKLLGYRMWTLGPNGILNAIHQTTSWQSGINEAVCLKYNRGRRISEISKCQNDPVSFKICTCGFYGRYTTVDLFTQVGPPSRTSMFNYVIGAFYGSGMVVHGKEGFRAAKAQVAALCPLLTYNSSDFKAALIKANSIYEVPIFKTMDDLLAEFPPDDVSNILDELNHEEQERIELYKKEVQKALEESMQAFQVYFPQPITTTGTTTLPPNALIPNGSGITITASGSWIVNTKELHNKWLYTINPSA